MYRHTVVFEDPLFDSWSILEVGKAETRALLWLSAGGIRIFSLNNQPHQFHIKDVCLPQWLKIVSKVWVKKWSTLRNWPLVKNLQFWSYSHESLYKRKTQKMIIFTKLHEDKTKNMDFLLMTIFWTCLVFLDSDFTYRTL